MKIKSGNFEVISSGTVIQVKDEDVSFEFTNPNGAPLIFIFEFKDSEDKSNQNAEFNLIKENCLKITLYNANSLGIGNSQIMELGNYQKRKFYLNYRLYTVGKLGKTIHYTFYLGEQFTNENS